MAGQLFIEDIAVGTELPTLVKTPTSRDLVKFAGGSGDYNEIHYDLDFVKKTGQNVIIVHGRLKTGYLTQMITNWISPLGMIRRFNIRFRDTDAVNDTITCGGTVTKISEEGGEHLVEADVWTEGAKGSKTTTGTIVFTLPKEPLDPNRHATRI